MTLQYIIFSYHRDSRNANDFPFSLEMQFYARLCVCHSIWSILSVCATTVSTAATIKLGYFCYKHESLCVLYTTHIWMLCVWVITIIFLDRIESARKTFSQFQCSNQNHLFMNVNETKRDCAWGSSNNMATFPVFNWLQHLYWQQTFLFFVAMNQFSKPVNEENSWWNQIMCILQYNFFFFVGVLNLVF